MEHPCSRVFPFDTYDAVGNHWFDGISFYYGFKILRLFSQPMMLNQFGPQIKLWLKLQSIHQKFGFSLDLMELMEQIIDKIEECLWKWQTIWKECGT